MSAFLNTLPLIETFGLLGVYLCVFAESGLFFGFFLPGDSLLFTAGLLASEGRLNFWFLAIGAFIAAVLGDSAGYAFGRKIGPALFTKKDSFFFNQKYVERAEKFYEKYGKMTIIIARFTPIVRSFAPIIAGVGKMKYSTFFSYNVVGGFLWTFGLSSLGYFLGRVIPNVDRYLLPLIILIIVLSFLPGLIQYLKSRKHKDNI